MQPRTLMQAVRTGAPYEEVKDYLWPSHYLTTFQYRRVELRYDLMSPLLAMKTSLARIPQSAPGLSPGGLLRPLRLREVVSEHLLQLAITDWDTVEAYLLLVGAKIDRNHLARRLTVPSYSHHGHDAVTYNGPHLTTPILSVLPFLDHMHARRIRHDQ